MQKCSIFGRNRSGFSLIELLVVLSIISILVAVVGIAASDSRQQGFDAQRQTDVQLFKTAIEQYKAQNGRYPEMGCEQADGWSKQAVCNDFIEGLGPFLAQPPRDPRPGSGDGYVYRTNADGTVYKFMARGTVETTVTTDHPLQACPKAAGAYNCGLSCSTTDTNYDSSYAVWGGFADGTSPMNVWNNTRLTICVL